MQVEIFTLCDAATVCSGKLNVLGTFDTLNFAKFPHEYGSFSIATRVRFGPEEIGEHSMHVKWIDPDGEVVEDSSSCDFEVNFLERRELWNHIWHYHGKEFFGANEYLLQLVVDENPIASVPLTIRLKK